MRDCNECANRQKATAVRHFVTPTCQIIMFISQSAIDCKTIKICLQ